MTVQDFVDGAYAQRILPSQVSWREAVEFGDVITRCFEQEPLFWWWWGPQYQFNNDHAVVRQQIKDPRQRLVELNNRALAYGRLVRTWARDTHLRVYGRGYLFQGLYNRDHELIGYANWQYPKHMESQLELELGRTGVLFWIKRQWLRLKYWVADKWEFWGTGEHPLRNPRLDEYYNTVGEHPDFKAINPDASDDTYQKLSGLSRDELYNTPYPGDDEVYLSMFMLLPEYQGKGYGTKFLNWCLDDIPVVDTPFEYKGAKSWGPQKLELQSSLEGMRLYQKCGFNEVHYYEDERDGKMAVNSTRLLIRG